MFNRLRLWLGPTRLWALFLLLAVTGLASLVLNTMDSDQTAWVTPAQNILVVAFALGAAVIIGSRMDPFERGRWLGILAPAFGLILLGAMFAREQLLLFMGGALGWIIVALFILRPRGPMAYQEAIKAFRKNNYQDAVAAITDLIKQEPDRPEHYRLRAEFLRVWGKLDRAKKDYEKVASLRPEDWVGLHGVAEVELQRGRLDAARKAAEQAYALDPQQWVIAYNLGMIEDRANNPEAALRYLDAALAHKGIDSHYRFLMHFYRARNYARLGQQDAAEAEVRQLKSLGGGLNQWQIILQSEQAETLRAVLEDDIRAAEALYHGQTDAMALAQPPTLN